MIGIYTIINTLNNKVYIGYSKNINARLKGHLNSLRRGNHDNERLQRSFNKYGEDKFRFEVLEECDTIYLISQEHYWCNILKCHNDKFGYNILPTHPDKLSSSHSTETKRKISKANLGRRQTPEHTEKVASQRRGKTSNRKGVKLSEETIERLRKSHIGKKASEETKKRMSESQKKRYLCKQI